MVTSALYVDFDNVYGGLEQLDRATAVRHRKLLMLLRVTS
jgi:hypothetical protein